MSGPLPDGHVRKSDTASNVPRPGAPRRLEGGGCPRLGLRRAWSATREALHLAAGAASNSLGRLRELHRDRLARARGGHRRGTWQVGGPGDACAEECVRSRVVAPHQQAARRGLPQAIPRGRSRPPRAEGSNAAAARLSRDPAGTDRACVLGPQRRVGADGRARHGSTRIAANRLEGVMAPLEPQGHVGAPRRQARRRQVPEGVCTCRSPPTDPHWTPRGRPLRAAPWMCGLANDEGTRPRTVPSTGHRLRRRRGSGSVGSVLPGHGESERRGVRGGRSTGRTGSGGRGMLSA